MPLFALAGLALIPWVILVVALLPSTHRSAHWDVAWGGFDVALALLLLAVAVAVWRRSPWLEAAATAAATLLLVDAWFDILTSSTRIELGVALAEAVLVEIPMALLCLYLARGIEPRDRHRVAGRSRSSRSATRRSSPPDVRTYNVLADSPVRGRAGGDSIVHAPPHVARLFQRR